MFNYFRKCLSNAHQVCHEDSLTKGMYHLCQSDDLALHSMSQQRLKLGNCLTCCLIVIAHTIFNLSSGIQLGMTVDLCMAYMLTLILMTLTLMQSHSGWAEETRLLPGAARSPHNTASTPNPRYPVID